jgi:hypothetical protein
MDSLLTYLRKVSISTVPLCRNYLPHRLDGLLRRLGLLLSVYNRHIRDVDLHEVVLARSSPQLAHSLNEGHALNIAHCASQLNYADIGLLARVIDGYPRDLLDPVLNRIGNVWHDLYGFAQVVALALALDDVLVDLARRDVVVASEGDVEVALVVAEIEVDFAAVGEDKNLAMPGCRLVLSIAVCLGRILLGIHSPRIDIEVRVDFDRRDVLRRQYAW